MRRTTKTYASCATLLLCLLLVKHAVAQGSTKLPADQVTKIEAAVASTMSRAGIPSVSIAIVVDNEIRFTRAFGMADLENSVPAKPVTVYRIASVTKPLTAVAAMQLVEKGKLDLDAPVQKYVPSFPVKDHPITPRLLLANMSGIRHYKKDEAERTTRYENLTQALDVFKDDPLLFEPGTRFGYTTFGFTLLGAVIEGASGMNYEEYMRENVFKPAGMQHTQVDDNFALIPNRARGYRPKTYGVFNGEVRNSDLMDSSYKTPGGGFVSTAEDMARFAIAVQNGVLIKPETFEQMSKSQKTRDGKDTGYGFGWSIEGRNGREPDGSVWHGGVQSGFTADLWLWPKKRFALVILTNLEGGGRLGLGDLANQIAEIVLQ